ncbi:MAG: hypothetical protein JWR85_3827 [Marmoricola sp.]|nr:hypothetical protein [Marmoricola sp.]
MSANKPHISGLFCHNCWKRFGVLDLDDFRRFFEGKSRVCPGCGIETDIWAELWAEMDQDNILVPGTLALGLVTSTHLTFPMTEGEHIFIDLGKEGIPDDATLMDVFITPNADGDHFPLYPTLGLQRLQRQEVPRVFTIHPTQYIGPRPSKGGKAAVMVLWLAAQSEPEMQPLVVMPKHVVRSGTASRR